MGRVGKATKRRVNFAVIVVDSLFNALFFFLGRVFEDAGRGLDVLSLPFATDESEILFLDIMVVMVGNRLDVDRYVVPMLMGISKCQTDRDARTGYRIWDIEEYQILIQRGFKYHRLVIVGNVYDARQKQHQCRD